MSYQPNPQIEKEYQASVQAFSKFLHELPSEVLEKLGIAIEKREPITAQLQRWKPENDDMYFLIDRYGEVKHDYSGSVSRVKELDFFNCFQTAQEAGKEALRTRARRKLEWLATELNRGKFGHTNYYIAGSIIMESKEIPVLGGVYFFEAADAEEALSQMTQEELEALH